MEPMKDSGYRFIGDIPKSWDVGRLNSYADLYGRIGWQGLTSDEYTDEGAWLVTGTDFENGKINWDSCVHVSEQRWKEAYQIQLKNGDILITKDGTVGKLAIVEDLPGHASLNSGVMRIVPKAEDYDSKYLYYVLQSEVFKEWFKDINAGASTIQHLFQGDFKHFIFPMPDYPEQKNIAELLDKRVDKLDKQTSILEQQITTLESYKSSLIHEAVTKGLDPNAPTKPSGVEWIGKIPTKWNCFPLRYVAEQNSKTRAFDSNKPYIALENIESKTGRILPSDEEIVAESNVANYNEDEILFSKLRPYLTKVVRPKTAGQCTTELLPIKPTSCNRDYLFWVLISPGFINVINNYSYGVKMPRANWHQLGHTYIPLPGIDEQEAIAEYLDNRCSKIDAILDIKRQQVEVLKKRRQSLIFEYVTGKRRVTQEA